MRAGVHVCVRTCVYARLLFQKMCDQFLIFLLPMVLRERERWGGEKGGWGVTSTDGHESVAKPPTYYKTCCTQQTDQSRCPRSVLVELDSPLPCVIVGALVFRSEAIT